MGYITRKENWVYDENSDGFDDSVYETTFDAIGFNFYRAYHQSFYEAHSSIGCFEGRNGLAFVRAVDYNDSLTDNNTYSDTLSLVDEGNLTQYWDSKESYRSTLLVYKASGTSVQPVSEPSSFMLSYRPTKVCPTRQIKKSLLV